MSKKNRSTRRVTDTGTIEWTLDDGTYHRDGDKPAVIKKNGSKFWYKHGFLHREGDKPAAKFCSGSEEWRQDGILHRIGGPAYMTPSREEWYQNGKRHRTDGPAVIYKSQKAHSEWWLFGQQYFYTEPPALFSVALDSFQKLFPEPDK